MFVRKYKKQKRNTEKEYYFKKICEILSNHIRAIKQILLGNSSDGISIKVFDYMLKNMKSTTVIKDEQMFRMVVPQIVQKAGFDQNDVEQIIYTVLLQLIKSYKYEKISFLQYATFLLPKRIISYIWKESKDAQQQLTNITDTEEETQYQRVDAEKHTQAMNIEEYMNVLTNSELRQFYDLDKDEFRKNIQIYKLQQQKQINSQIIANIERE